MNISIVKQMNPYQKNITFSGSLVQNRHLSKIQNADNWAWKLFEKSNYFKLLNSKLCSGKYSIEQIDYNFCAGYSPSTTYMYGLFKDGIECEGKRGSISCSQWGTNCNLEGFIETFKNAIAKDILETQNILE